MCHVVTVGLGVKSLFPGPLISYVSTVVWNGLRRHHLASTSTNLKPNALPNFSKMLAAVLWKRRDPFPIQIGHCCLVQVYFLHYQTETSPLAMNYQRMGCPLLKRGSQSHDKMCDLCDSGPVHTLSYCYQQPMPRPGPIFCQLWEFSLYWHFIQSSGTLH